MEDREKESPSAPSNDTKPGDEQPSVPKAEAGEAKAEPSPTELQAQIADLEDRLLRALAEQENIRMRAQRDLKTAVSFAASGFARDLLTTADNLRRALDSMPAERTSDETINRLIAGVEATERALLATFQQHGIQRFDPAGEAFDPNRHEVAQVIHDAEKPAGTVLQVLQPGYLYHDRLLRPAMVNVSGGPPKDRAENTSGSKTSSTEEQ